MYLIQLSMMHFRKIVSMPRTMVDYKNTVLTKTKISQKLFGFCKWDFHHLLIRACLMQQNQRKLRSLFKMASLVIDY